MESRASYFYIGIFVFGIFFASLFFLIWLSGFSSEEKFVYYQLFTKESTSGLSLKSPVKLLGVDVGSVEEMSIDTSNGIEVKILIKLKEGTPVMQNTYATFTSQGITGLKYIELKADDDYPPLPLSVKEGQIPTIEVRASLLATLSTQSEKIFHILDLIDERLNMVFSETNIENFSAFLRYFANVNKSLEPALNNLSTASQKVAIMADNVSELKSSFSSNLELLEELLMIMNETLSNLEKSPSDIFFKRSKNKLAPGE